MRYLTSVGNILFLVLLVDIAMQTRSVETEATCDESYLTYNKPPNKGFSSRKHGTLMVQSLMSVTGGEPCDYVTVGGLIRVQAVKYAIETWNQSQLNVDIGYQIDDTCLSLAKTMERGVEIVNTQRERTCSANHQDTCTISTKNNTGIILAVIGAYFSFTTIPLSSLLSVYEIPQLSYGASSVLLSKRSEFRSSFRSIPSDEMAVEAMIEVIKQFGWTYIFAVGSDDDYGKAGLRMLKTHASNLGICFTGEMYIPLDTAETREIAKDIAKAMEIESNATVVVMFNYALKMGEYILEEAEKLGLHRVYLTSEAWNPEVLSATNIPEKQLQSIFTISLNYGKADQEFLKYINSTIYNKYDCDIWLHQFIKQSFGCAVTSRHSSRLYGIDAAMQNCSVDIQTILDTVIKGNPNQINNLIDLVDSVMYAIDSVLIKSCSSSPHSIQCQQKIQPKDINAALQGTSFTTRQNRTFAYDKYGNPSYVSYSLEQIQFEKTLNRYAYKPFGYWKSKSSPKLFVDVDKIKVPFWASNGQLPSSSCGVDCTPGQYVIAPQRCCWECKNCLQNHVSNTTNAKECMQCPVGYHTKNSIGCKLTPIYHVTLSDGIGIAMTLFSVLGLFLILISLVFIYMYKETSAIKSFSKRFLVSSTILLLLTFLYTVLHLMTPTTVLCRIRNTYFHMMLTLFSLLLLIKNSSVSHFISKFVSNKKNSTLAEILVSLGIVLPEVGLIITWQLKETFPITMTYTDYEYFEECEIEFTLYRMLSFALPFIIIVVASIQSLSERHTKFRFGEYKFLHYTCVAFCIINIAHVVTLNQVAGKYQVLVMLITTISYGYIFIVCMIITKIFHAMTEPKRRANTMDGVCNIGFQSEKPQSSSTTSFEK